LRELKGIVNERQGEPPGAIKLPSRNKGWQGTAINGAERRPKYFGVEESILQFNTLFLGIIQCHLYVHPYCILDYLWKTFKERDKPRASPKSFSVELIYYISQD